ncbi:MAG: putative lipid II flippase FtsW, partial [Thermodesulfobacteriota bacterium]
RLPYRVYKKLAYPILFSAIGMLLLVHVPGISLTAGGATRWIKLGPVSFQPSEMARLSLVIFLAYSMAKKREAMGEFSIGVIPHVLLTLFLCALLMTQPDFGSSVLLVAVAGVMMFVGGARLSHLFLLGLCALPLAGVFIITAEYRLRRIMSFWNPWACEANEGYQVVHSLLAYGTGGLTGQGLGGSFQKLFYLPEPHTDFIFSVLGEELGLCGVLTVLAIYGVVVWRGLAIAKAAPDRFGAYLATGITAGVGLSACVNIAVTMGLLPTKGLSLPFLSYGGTGLLINLFAIGVLCNVAASGRRGIVIKDEPVTLRSVTAAEVK